MRSRRRLETLDTNLTLPRRDVIAAGLASGLATMLPARLQELFGAAMEIWQPDLPGIQLVQNHHRIPMNTSYWKTWATVENHYINGASWHLTFPLVLWNLQPV